MKDIYTLKANETVDLFDSIVICRGLSDNNEFVLWEKGEG